MKGAVKIKAAALLVAMSGVADLSYVTTSWASGCPGVVATCTNAIQCSSAPGYCAATKPASCTIVKQTVCLPNQQCHPPFFGNEIECFYQ
jgi:hypothetical protein